MNKVATISLKGNEYATVPQRLKAFRESNPRAVIDTDYTKDGDTMVFKAKIISDKSDPNSPEATGHSYGKFGEAKAFEKQETIAVGRALALLGYLNNGQVATTEEMEEFEAFKVDQFNQVIEQIKQAKSRDEFAQLIAGLTPEQKREVTPIINERIQELKNGKVQTSS